MKQFLFSILFSAGLNAQAATPLAQDFLRQGSSIPKALVGLGYSQFGELDLQSLLGKMNSVQILTASAKQVMQKNSDGRPTAHWQRGLNGTTVTVSPELWNDYLPDVKPLISLHEFLGGAGFDDTNYHLSSALWLLSTSEAQKNLNPGEQKILEDYISRARSTGGGVIGVGGGGDVVGSYVKKTVLLKKIKAFNQMRGAERQQGMQFIFLILNMDINLTWKDRK